MHPTPTPDWERLYQAFDPPMPPETRLRLEVNLHLAESAGTLSLAVGLRTGIERLYVVKDWAAFEQTLSGGEPMPFGKRFVLDGETMRLEACDQRLLALLLEATREYAEDAPSQKFTRIPSTYIVRVLRFLRARSYRLFVSEKPRTMDAIERLSLPITCNIEEQNGALRLSFAYPRGLLPIGDTNEFLLTPHGICQTMPGQRALLRALLPHASHGQLLLEPPKQETARMLCEVLPQLEQASTVTLSPTLATKLRREPLTTRVSLDRDGERVLCAVIFQYNQIEIDPFQPSGATLPQDTYLVRDMAGEHAVLETLSQAGFRVGKGQVYLAGDARILQFLLEGVAQLQDVSTVWVSDAFKRLSPRRPQLAGRLSMEGGALSLTVTADGVPLADIEGFLKALAVKRKYYRLPTGAYLALEGLEGWQEAANALEEATASDHPTAPLETAITLKAYRAVYLESLIRQAQLPIDVDEATQKIAHEVQNPTPLIVPETLSGILRPYQRRGFEWLSTLYRLRMGGVLADDMGLGKTLEAIAALLWAKAEHGKKPSLVVAPSSLLYNWQAEIKRYAPSLNVLINDGPQAQRIARFQALRDETDVVITSYPLLRRDVDAVAELPFRFVFLDEAQAIKNPGSLAAEAAQRITAETRIAMTGTPMENSPAELWSIFHFVLPGYLGTQADFLSRYGDGAHLEPLSRRIRPFLLRRLKSEVLPELPPKIETRVLVDLPPDQKAAYAATSLQLKERVEKILSSRGIGRGRMEILSAITQLRQMACHPRLVLPDYRGGCGKLDAVELMVDTIVKEGRRALIFSAFTSMLDLLRRSLVHRGIACQYLDGQTPIAERLTRVEQFNAGTGQVFLISLKAGGAGLTLTGADTVIHYDPWWNPAAENQAADRAHRIGQTKTVQVIRLIARGTIEEQVIALGERKKQLFDAVITAGERLPNEMTEQELLSLFT